VREIEKERELVCVCHFGLTHKRILGLREKGQEQCVPASWTMLQERKAGAVGELSGQNEDGNCEHGEHRVLVFVVWRIAAFLCPFRSGSDDKHSTVKRSSHTTAENCGAGTALTMTSSPVSVNHFDVLGVDRKASKGDIRKAYQRLLLKWHPDKNFGSEESTEIFKRINEAYKVQGCPCVELARHALL